MYTRKNYKTKKELKEAFKHGAQIPVYQPGGIFPDTKDGEVTIEGPHYPEPHRWYARVKIEDGIIVRIIS